MSLNNRIKKISAALTSIEGLNCYHYTKPSSIRAPYAVWYELQEDSSFGADNHKREQVLMGYVDYFTQTEFDDNIDKIEAAFDDAENCWCSLESVQYEDETKLIHYTWEWWSA